MEVKESSEQEKRQILNRYRGLLRASQHSNSREDRRRIRKAFNTALEAHSDMRRRSGEPYIFHPIAVARIVAEEMRLGTTSIVAALLHDTVEDTNIDLAYVEREFGKKVATIIDGLTKIPGSFDQHQSPQAENFRKMLLSLSEDVRVILIKLADRLHNMRTLDSMKREKQLKIASETEFLYAPLSHRLGLYSIKTELEDLALKFKEPEEYERIRQKLKKGKEVRARFINRFVRPIKEDLNKEGYDYQIKSRTKSIHSIFEKIRNKGVAFEEIYDLFAIRIILNSPPETEKADCWKVYSIVTDHYKPNPDRLRDWISTPKANGYESLHTTVMSPTGKWVEVQIRSERMDEVAEMGYAAHWRYKEQEKTSEGNLDRWLTRVRELLGDPESNALEFLDDLKLNLFSDEIFVFTPKGELKTLPSGATALDLAFEIHTDIGERCTGAKVNQKLVPLDDPLNSGDQVEILTSKDQKPKEDWLNYVVTAKARSKIKTALNKEKKKAGLEGKERLERKLDHMKLSLTDENLNTLIRFFNVPNEHELYFRIAKGAIDLKRLKELDVKGKTLKLPVRKEEEKRKYPEKKATVQPHPQDTLIIGEDLRNTDYKLAPCCQPIPGDDVFGYITSSDGVKIHRTNCPNATELMSRHAQRIISARWASQEKLEFTAGIKITGLDGVGMVNRITDIISDQ
ncbi:MAG: bifunctional (p)ppGpp synthetase/guanosine-3',5'-bis(diphosphate) 3'-pyrophosphohydrolase, partial [Flavobacteriales bacterium]